MINWSNLFITSIKWNKKVFKGIKFSFVIKIQTHMILNNSLIDGSFLEKKQITI